MANIDLRLSKRMNLLKAESAPYLEFHADAFNVLNQVNLRNFVGTLSSEFFGRANAAFPARQLQLTLKLRF